MALVDFDRTFKKHPVSASLTSLTGGIPQRTVPESSKDIRKEFHSLCLAVTTV